MQLKGGYDSKVQFASVCCRLVEANHCLFSRCLRLDVKLTLSVWVWN